MTEHIINAQNAQESARLIQESYQESTGHKLKRAFILNGLSKALKFANKKVMGSTHTSSTNKNKTLLHIGYSSYSHDINDNIAPTFFYSHISEDDVLSQIREHAFNSLSNHSELFPVSEVFDRISKNTNANNAASCNKFILVAPLKDFEKNLKPNAWLRSSWDKVRKNMAEFHALKSILIDVMLSSPHLAGGYNINPVVIEMPSEKQSKPYPAEIVEKNGETYLQGLFEVDINSLCDDVNIECYLNSTIFSTDYIVMEDASLILVHDHGRITLSDTSVFVFVKADIELLSFNEMEYSEIVDDFMKHSV